MREKIREYISKHLVGRGVSFGDSDSLFANGGIDSLGHLKLIAFLEKEFGVALAMEDLTWENFDTIEKIEKLVRQRLGR